MALIAAVAAGCGANRTDTTVAVNATDSQCDVAQTALKAGNIRFNFTNNGKKTNELYVLGDKDRIVDEVENVTPGTTRALDVNLKAGSYTLACKPGQTGDGIRTKITVTGAGGKTGAATAKADRTIGVDAHEYAFTFAQPVAVKQGEAIAFELANKGQEHHEFEVLGPDGKAIGEIAAVAPGKAGDATLQFAQTGAYTYQCLVKTSDGRLHKDLGMTGTFEVA